MSNTLYRYGLLVRFTHWMNVLCLAVLLMSGLQIFNAHPALYWGEDSDFEHPFVSITSDVDAEGRPVGVTFVAGRRFNTDGLLGRSELRGQTALRAFPGWLTIPSFQDLATGRVWHFFFAWIFAVNGLVYVAHTIISGRFVRDLLPARKDWRHIAITFADHLRLRFPKGPAAARYNIVQRLTYLGVVLLVAPLAIASGLTMSPAIDAAMPWLLDLLGGRQSARTIHFITALTLLAFVVIHVTLVALSGLFNNVRSMVTGWFALGR